jgi:hypothetical protein
MNPSRSASYLLGVGVALALGSGCSPDAPPAAPSGSVSSSPTASASPIAPSAQASASPSLALTAAQQEAFEQATEVVMAYSQTVTDLYSGARTRINDLDNFVTGDLLEIERSGVQKDLGLGVRSEPKGAQLALVSAQPVSVKLKADPPTVVLWACIDGSAVTGVDKDGTSHPGKTERLQYRVIKTAYLPAPGWAVTEVKGERDPEEREC